MANPIQYLNPAPNKNVVFSWCRRVTSPPSVASEAKRSVGRARVSQGRKDRQEDSEGMSWRVQNYPWTKDLSTQPNDGRPVVCALLRCAVPV